MRIAVGSLQYSPIFKSLCCAFGRQCETSGHEVRYILNSEYRWMLQDELKRKSAFVGSSGNSISALIDGMELAVRRKIREFFLEFKPNLVYLHNIHPILNNYVAICSQKVGARFVQHFHEPYVDDKSAYELGHRMTLYLLEMLQERLLRRVSIAIVSSVEARRLFVARYPAYARKVVFIPLMYEDLGNDNQGILPRRYVTFIGPPVSAKGQDTFLDVVDTCEKRNLDIDFLLISRRKIRDARFLGRRNLRVFERMRISDPEIGDMLTQSIAAIAPYKTARQSSVVATSNMYGTPVVCTNIEGLREAVIHKQTGYLVNRNATVDEWISGIDFVKDHQQEMAGRCRSYFIDSFSDSNWPKHLPKILRGDQTG